MEKCAFSTDTVEKPYLKNSER